METFDAVIIGSGAGGAPVAYELVRAGKTVLILEKGPELRIQADSPTGLSDFKRDELYGYGPEKIIDLPGVVNRGAPFFPSHVEPDLNDEAHIYAGLDEQNPIATTEGYTAQVVGGGTQLYGAVHLRFTREDFQLATFNQGRGALPGNPLTDSEVSIIDWPFSYDDLAPYYLKVEELVGLNGTTRGQLKDFKGQNKYQTPLAPNPISAFAKAGMEALGGVTYRTPLAVITADHAPSGRTAGNDPEQFPKTSYVNRYGDPMGYKSNTYVALLRPTLRDPALAGRLTLRCNCHVTHLSASGAAVDRVHYRDPSGEERVVGGKVVVVACSAIESTRLLMISCEEDRGNFGARFKYQQNDGLLGRYFLTHCFGGAEVALRGHRFDKSISLDSDYATDFTAAPDFLQAHQLWAGAAIYNNTSDQALPLSLGRTHRSTDLDSLWQGFMEDTGIVGDGFNAWIDHDMGTRLSVSFMGNQIPWFRNHIRLHGSTDKWGRKNAFIIKDWHPHDHHLMGVITEQCRRILELGIPADQRSFIENGSVKDQGVRIANHILGGARFGHDPSHSVLDPDCRAWGFDNLYVTDGSCMPTSGGANPTHTIEANAFRVADKLKTRI
jgi:choline dehydrogenase-like flavoprotein